MDQLTNYLEGTQYNLVNASDLNIHEIQDRLKQCRADDDLVVFVEKCEETNGFFDRLEYFKLDTQKSNYYIAHSRNYAVWVDPSELTKDDLLSFLHQSKTSITPDDTFFGDYSEYGNKTDRVV